jgi:hypothetical protein
MAEVGIDITANTPRLLNYTAKAQVQYTSTTAAAAAGDLG